MTTGAGVDLGAVVPIVITVVIFEAVNALSDEIAESQYLGSDGTIKVENGHKGKAEKQQATHGLLQLSAI